MQSCIEFLRLARHYKLAYWFTKQSKIHRSSKVSRGCTLEGSNRLGRRSEISNTHMGLGTYIGEDCKIRGAKVGRFCALGDYVRIGLGRHPAKDWVSIHSIFFSGSFGGTLPLHSTKRFDEHLYVDSAKGFHTEIGNDVWVANNVTIQDGLTIGDGAIVALGSFVTTNIEPYAIYGGVPARKIRLRFKPEQIEFLRQSAWWDRPMQWLQEHIDDFSDIELAMKHWKASDSYQPSEELKAKTRDLDTAKQCDSHT